jgi:aspartate carbamoyltransferase regulatory subunit
MARPRSNAEIVSQLKEYQVRRSKEWPQYLIVLCPNEDCPSHQKRGKQKPFVVHADSWRALREYAFNGAVIRGRSCPYCMRVATHPSIKLD